MLLGELGIIHFFSLISHLGKLIFRGCTDLAKVTQQPVTELGFRPLSKVPWEIFSSCHSYLPLKSVPRTLSSLLLNSRV